MKINPEPDRFRESATAEALMKMTLKTGSIRNIIIAVAGMANIEHDVKRNTIRVFTDTTERDLKRSEMDAAREKLLGSRERDNVLIAFQRWEYGAQAWNYTLATNIYGYAVGDSLISNIGGGTWNQMARGASLEEAIKFGCEKSARANVSFEFGLNYCPPELSTALILIATRKINEA